MLKDRRIWINKEKAANLGKPPEEIKGFYDQYNVEAPLSPEDEAARKAAEEEESKASKKKDKKKEKKGKGKKKKSAGDDDDGAVPVIKAGPPEVVQKFDE